MTVDPGSGHRHVVFDYEANPYPHGIAVEGFAILFKSDKWKLRESGSWNIKVNSAGQTQFCQYGMWSLKSDGDDSEEPWLLLVNIHAGHKINHFENAVAIIDHCSEFVDSHEFCHSFAGKIFAGDFNAQLFRPSNGNSEVSDIASFPWEVSVSSQFDSRTSIDSLHQQLIKYNSSDYKAWATIKDENESRKRIEAAVKLYKHWLQKFGNSETVEEALWKTRKGTTYGGPEPERLAPDATTWVSDRVDHVFTDSHFSAENAFVVFKKANWKTLESVSDHPGVFVVGTWKPAQFTEQEFWKSTLPSLADVEKALGL